MINENFAGFLVVFFFLIGLTIGCCAGWDTAIDSARLSATKAGVAEFVTKAQTGKTTFRWKRELVKENDD